MKIHPNITQPQVANTLWTTDLNPVPQSTSNTIFGLTSNALITVSTSFCSASTVSSCNGKITTHL